MVRRIHRKKNLLLFLPIILGISPFQSPHTALQLFNDITVMADGNKPQMKLRIMPPMGHRIRFIFTAIRIDFLQIPEVLRAQVLSALQKNPSLQDKTEGEHIVDIILTVPYHFIAVTGDIPKDSLCTKCHECLSHR